MNRGQIGLSRQVEINPPSRPANAATNRAPMRPVMLVAFSTTQRVVSKPRDPQAQEGLSRAV